jgi:hypothetical protein
MSDELHPQAVYFQNPGVSDWRGRLVDNTTSSWPAPYYGWSDNDDSTWVTLGGGSRIHMAANGWLPNYSPTGTATGLILHARIQSASGGGTTALAASIVHDTGGTSPAYDLQLSLPVSNDGITADLALTVASADFTASGTDLATVVAALSSGTPRAIRFDDPTTQSIFIFEAWLEVTVAAPTTSFAPPQRLTNRDDMFASARRLTGSSSRQGSNRLTGYL